MNLKRRESHRISLRFLHCCQIYKTSAYSSNTRTYFLDKIKSEKFKLSTNRRELRSSRWNKQHMSLRVITHNLQDQGTLMSR